MRVGVAPKTRFGDIEIIGYRVLGTENLCGNELAMPTLSTCLFLFFLVRLVLSALPISP